MNPVGTQWGPSSLAKLHLVPESQVYLLTSKLYRMQLIHYIGLVSGVQKNDSVYTHTNSFFRFISCEIETNFYNVDQFLKPLLTLLQYCF